MFDSAAIAGLGTPELLLILLIVLLLFGSKKLPELSRSLGTSMHELRKGMSGDGKKGSEKENRESVQ
jgi:sec-independent protein translocase protein TatA